MNLTYSWEILGDGFQRNMEDEVRFIGFDSGFLGEKRVSMAASSGSGQDSSSALGYSRRHLGPSSPTIEEKGMMLPLNGTLELERKDK